MSIYWLLLLPLFFVIGWVAARVDFAELLDESSVYNRYDKNFQEDLKLTICNTSPYPSWATLQDLALSHLVPQASIYSSLLELQKEVLTGRDKELLPHKELIATYISEYRQSEPFSEVPERIRSHLEHLLRIDKANFEILKILATEVESLSKINSRENSLQRRYTYWGYVAGIFGVLLALTAIFFPEITHQMGAVGQNVLSNGTK